MRSCELMDVCVFALAMLLERFLAGTANKLQAGHLCTCGGTHLI